MSKQIVIELPENPLNKDYEDFISAYFQSGGYYVERNIIERETEEILELDIVITDFEEDYPDPILIEIKSGGWGFPDIFKIAGWLRYTVFNKGMLIVKKGKDNMAFYKDKAENQIGIRLIHNSDYKNTASDLADFINFNNIDDKDIEAFRFSYWVETNLLTYLRDCKKEARANKSGLKCYEALEYYYFQISSEIFTSPNLLDRIRHLYDAFMKYPLISAKCCHELDGGNFDDSVTAIPRSHFIDTYQRCKLNIIQVSTFIEHQARLTILKNCIEYTCCKSIRQTAKTNDKASSAFPSKLAFLPTSFVNGLVELQSHEYCHRYPVFWQWFFYGFGGFILLDLKEKEYKLLSEKTGIPVEYIDEALSAYNILFPKSGGWLSKIPNTNILGMNLFSVALMGNGANYRRYYYTKGQKFEELIPKLNSDFYSYNDMIKWNNFTVEVLNRGYKPEVKPLADRPKPVKP